MTLYLWFHLDHPFHLLTFSNPKCMIISYSPFFSTHSRHTFFFLSISSFFFTILPPKHSFSFIIKFFFLILYFYYPLSFCHFLLPSLPPPHLAFMRHCDLHLFYYSLSLSLCPQRTHYHNCVIDLISSNNTTVGATLDHK